jgi:hypothetical protein
VNAGSDTLSNRHLLATRPKESLDMAKLWLTGAALVGSTALLPVISHAQLNLSQFGLGGAPQSNSPDNASLTQLLQKYVGANQQVLAGQSNLASAMGLGAAAGEARSAASALGGTPVNALNTDALSRLSGTQQSVSQSLQRAFASTAQPVGGATGKQAFTDGLASLGKGVGQYAGLQSDLGAMSNAAGAQALLQGAMNPATAQALSYVAQSAPGQLQMLVSTLSQAVQYARSHGISIPAAATAALGSGQ